MVMQIKLVVVVVVVVFVIPAMLLLLYFFSLAKRIFLCILWDKNSWNESSQPPNVFLGRP